MSICMIHQELTFTPMLLSDLISKFKNKAIDTTDKLIVKSIYKLFEIVYDESLEFNKIMAKARVEFTITEMENFEMEKLYDYLEKQEDRLWIIHNLFKDSTNIYEIQLFDLIDNTLNNYAKINNILGYFESQVIQNNLKSA